jgi:hypothetical protein
MSSIIITHSNTDKKTISKTDDTSHTETICRSDSFPDKSAY